MNESIRGAAPFDPRRIAAGVGLTLLAAGFALAGTATASADSGDCFVDRGVTDAAALCHSGTGRYVLSTECQGFFVPPGQVVPVYGPYRGSVSTPTPVDQPMRASCLFGGALGITTGASLAPA
ncbi:hypothetical protein [Nocardia callitridis]|uniref:Uncharacterized protein n=1 Tax=Nocardia callitridis TaxID=648753 RepID=A0ABP9L5A8_9NOCA